MSMYHTYLKAMVDPSLFHSGLAPLTMRTSATGTVTGTRGSSPTTKAVDSMAHFKETQGPPVLKWLRVVFLGVWNFSHDFLDMHRGTCGHVLCKFAKFGLKKNT